MKEISLLLLSSGHSSLGFLDTLYSLYSSFDFLLLLSSPGRFGVQSILINIKLKQRNRYRIISVRSTQEENSYSSKQSLHVIFLFVVKAVIDESEAGGSASSELGLKSVDGDAFFLGLELLCKLRLDGCLGHVGHIGVDHLNGLLKDFSLTSIRIIFFLAMGSSKTFYSRG